MQTTRLNSYVTQLTRLGCMNCYLVQEDDGLTLVDTSISGSTRLILGATAALRGTIQRILLTHAHADHIGSLDGLRAVLPEAEVLIGAREARLLKKDFSLEPGEPSVKPRGTFSGARTAPTRLLQDGDTICHLHAISTPGHTPGHMAFLDERTGMVLAGDALVGFGGLRTPGDSPWFFPLPDFATWHVPTVIESARKLARMDVEGIVTGHGPALQGAGSCRAAIHDAIEHAEQKSGRRSVSPA